MVMRRARRLHESLEGEEDTRSEAKRRLVEDMPLRSLGNNDII